MYHTEFPIIRARERKPFDAKPSQTFFRQWAAMNDSIEPRFLSREEWVARGGFGSMLETIDDKKKALYVPMDLRLTEIIPVIQAVDADTYAKRPELIEQRSQKLLDLGKKFKHAGIYIQERIEGVPPEAGRLAAAYFAQAAYNYGNALMHSRPDLKGIDESILENYLNTDEEQEVDQWLLGESVYEKRMARLRKKHNIPEDAGIPREILEPERRALLKSYFGVMQKETTQKMDPNTPWKEQNSVVRGFQKRAEAQVSKAAEMPQRELLRTFYNRGVEMLLQNMGFSSIEEQLRNIGLNVDAEYRRLYEVLEIDRLKEALNRIRGYGDPEATGAMQRNIAERIQKAVGAYRYQMGAADPSRMLERQELNCVGASVLGGALLETAGIPYLHGHVPEHALVCLVTEDQRVFWHDMLHAKANGEITAGDIEGVTIEDIIQCAQDEEKPRVQFKLSPQTYKDKISWTSIERPGVTLYRPEIGQQMDLLLTIGVRLQRSGQHREAAAVYNEAIRLDPQNAEMRLNQANAEGSHAGRFALYAEIEDSYRQAIALDPTNPYAYFSYANLLQRENKPNERQKTLEEAARRADEAIEHEPESPFMHHLASQIANALGDKKITMRERRTAERLYQRIAASSGDATGTLSTQFAQLLGEDGRAFEALQMLSTAARIDVDNVQLQQILSRGFSKRQQWIVALPYAERAAALYPTAESLVELAEVHTRLKQWDRAEAVWRQVIAIDPDSFIGHTRLSRCLREQQKYDEAITHVNEGMRINTPLPIDETIPEAKKEQQRTQMLLHTDLGIIYAKMDRPSNAEAEFNAALSLRPDYPYANEQLGKLYAQQGRTTEAKQRYHLAIDCLKRNAIDSYRGLANMMEKEGGSTREVLSVIYNIARLELRKFWHEAQRAYVDDQEYSIADTRNELSAGANDLPGWKRLLKHATVGVQTAVLKIVGGEYYRYINS